MTRRFPYWRVQVAAIILTVIVCVLAGAGVANAATYQPMHTGDGSGWGFCVAGITPGTWVCPR